VGLDLLLPLSDFPFFVFGGSSPKNTLPFAGRFLTADAQSVGAGCCPAGTSLIQIRHIPAGGKKLGGTICSRRDCDCCVVGLPGLTGTGRCAPARLAETTNPIAAGRMKRKKAGAGIKPKGYFMAFMGARAVPDHARAANSLWSRDLAICSALGKWQIVLPEGRTIDTPNSPAELTALSPGESPPPVDKAILIISRFLL